jgi:hypothetical protein
MIAPFFESLADKYPSLMFVKVDVDACKARDAGGGGARATERALRAPGPGAQGVAAECGITAMPTFQVGARAQP